MIDTSRVVPEHLTLSALIERLEREDPNIRLRLGFRNPHSYRDYYEQLAFEAADSVTVGEMLQASREALGTMYKGWKGGDFIMHDYTEVWLVVQKGSSAGETLGAVLLELLLANREEV